MPVTTISRPEAHNTTSADARAGRHSVLFGLTTAAVYLLALMKALVITRSFGTGQEMDAFAVAMILPNLVAAIAAANCGPAMVPVLASAAREGGQVRSNAFRSTLWLSTAVSLGIAAGLYLFADPLICLIAPHFDGARRSIAAELLRSLSLLPAASVVFGYCSAELLSRRKYFLVAAAPAISTAVTITAILNVRSITMLAYSVVAGTILQAGVVLVLSCWATRMTERLRLWTSHTQAVILAQLPLMGAMVFSVANFSIDQALAALLPPGNVSALNYAVAMNSLLMQSVVMAAAWVALPEFSDIASVADWNRLRVRARQYIVTLTAVAAPLTAAVLLFAEACIKIVFQHGAFTAASTALVSGAWKGYAWGLVPVAIGMVCVRLLNSTQSNRPLIVVGLVMLPLNVLLDVVLMRILGVFGLGLSTSLVYCCSTLLLLRLAKQRVGDLMDSKTIRSIGLILLGALAAAVMGVAARSFLGTTLLGLLSSSALLMATALGFYVIFGVLPLRPVFFGFVRTKAEVAPAREVRH